MLLKIFFYAFIIITQISFSTPKDVSSEKVITKNGKIYLKGTNELFTGTIKYKKDRERYVDGLAHGKWLSFYPNGKIKALENWKNGKLNGTFILYGENGKKTFQTKYLSGKENGSYRLYSDNGKIHVDGFFKNGKPVSTWKYYDANGNFLIKKKY